MLSTGCLKRIPGAMTGAKIAGWFTMHHTVHHRTTNANTLVGGRGGGGNECTKRQNTLENETAELGKHVTLQIFGILPAYSSRPGRLAKCNIPSVFLTVVELTRTRCARRPHAGVSNPAVPCSCRRHMRLPSLQPVKRPADGL